MVKGSNKSMCLMYYVIEKPLIDSLIEVYIKTEGAGDSEGIVRTTRRVMYQHT